MSGQCTWYQSESCAAPAGAVKVCASELSVPGLVLPTCAALLPPCAVATAAVIPLEVQPASPLSKPPLFNPAPPPPELVTVIATLAECVTEPSDPVIVTV